MPAPTPATTALLRALRDEIRQNNRAGRIVLAIDGAEGAGQAAFADALADVLADDGSAVFRASIDGFRRPHTETNGRGESSPEGYYRDSYDYGLFRRALIDPYRSGARHAETDGFRLTAVDVEPNAASVAPALTGPKDAVLLVDGIFLNRPELRGVWNWSLWLDGPAAMASAPIAALDDAEVGAEADADAQAAGRDLDAHQLYLREARPVAAASVIIDNTDPANPTRVYRDFC